MLDEYQVMAPSVERMILSLGLESRECYPEIDERVKEVD